MNGKRLRSALEKAGATIEKAGLPYIWGNSDTKEYVARLPNGRSSLVWYEDTEGNASCLRTPSEQTNILYDCFCDTYHKTIKGAVSFLLLDI